jgi:hypothetical protein
MHSKLDRFNCRRTYNVRAHAATPPRSLSTPAQAKLVKVFCGRDNTNIPRSSCHPACDAGRHGPDAPEALRLLTVLTYPSARNPVVLAPVPPGLARIALTAGPGFVCK